MSLSFVDPKYLLLLLFLPMLWLVALPAARLQGTRRWAAIALRTAIFLAIVLSLAGTQLLRPAHELTTVFLIDSSDSVSPAQRAQAEVFVEEALAAMGSADRAAIIVFGGNAIVERAPSDERHLGHLQSVPVAARTNIEEALTLALALFPADTQKRIVLLSDGAENQGRALGMLPLLQTRGIPVEIVSLGATTGSPEAAMLELRTVGHAREGQAIELVARVESSVAQPARLRFLGDNMVLHEQTVQLPAGTANYTTTVVVQGQGYHHYSAEVDAGQDTRVQNNAAGVLVKVDGPPRVLIVEGQAGEGQYLAKALAASQLQATTVTPYQMPDSLTELGAYETVVLVNVPSKELPTSIQERLRVYVRDLGRGLVMVGGTESYGVGGYRNTPLEEALPVYMDVRNRQQRPDIAIVFVIDKSGSMSGTTWDGGFSKLEVMKMAVLEATTVLGKEDKVGIVSFDSDAYSIMEPTKLPNQDTIEAHLAPLESSGGTNIANGLLAAEEMLLATDAKVKHVILLTDGYGGEPIAVAERMSQEGMTVSAIAAGADAADYLPTLASRGSGRYYNVPAVEDVPQIVLDETIHAVGTYIIEEPFTPAYAGESPILEGLQQGLPQLYGYNGTSEKEQARVILVGRDSAPVLAQWQYGLGRTVAWTSDLKGKWALDWVRWAEFPRFAAQLVGWTLPPAELQSVSASVTMLGSMVELNVDARDSSGQALTGLQVQATIIGAEQAPATLREVAPGRYVAQVPSPPAGTYLMRISGTEPSGKSVFVQTAGLQVAYSPEYRQQQANPQLLRALAEQSGGRQLNEPAAAFEHNLAVVTRSRQIAMPLLLLALLLLPLDIAVRRLNLGWQHLKELRAARTAKRRLVTSPTPVLHGLQGAKARTQERFGNVHDSKTTTPPIPDQPPAGRPPQPSATVSQPSQADPSPEELTDPLERLRAAKNRARRR